MNRFSNAGLRIETVLDIETIEKLFTLETYQLYEAVLIRSATKFEHLTREFFLEMARKLPGCCEFLFAFEGDGFVGFAIQLRSPQKFIPLFVGLNYDLPRNAELYFNLLYRLNAEGAGYGLRSVEIGQNADEVKCKKLAAVQSERSIYVRGSNSIMNTLICLLFNQIFPPHPLLIDKTMDHQAKQSEAC